MLRIKNDVISKEEVMMVSFGERDKMVVILFKCGATIIFANEVRQGVVTKDRVITAAEFEIIKDYFMITMKPEILI